MRDNKEETPSPANEDVARESSPDASDQSEKSNRRELIARYGKYAVVAAPLLMFVSKAHAIHSKP